MADDRMKLGIQLDVDANGTEIIDALVSKVRAMERAFRSITADAKKAASAINFTGKAGTSSTGATSESKAARDTLGFNRQIVTELKRKLALETRLANQRGREEQNSLRAFKSRMAFQARQTAQTERDEARTVQSRMRDEAQAFRQRYAFTSRMGRLAIQEEKSRAREQERSIASAARAESQRMRDRAADMREGQRRELADTRRHEREIARHESQRSRGYSDLRSGGSDIRQGLGRATMGAGVITAAGTAAAGSAARRGISTRMETDTAETNLRIFSGQTTEQIKAARKGFLDNEAIKLGMGIKSGLDAYSEVLKTGMASPAENTKTIMRAVSALELDLKDTTKLAGLIDRNFGASSTPAKIKSALNAVAVAAREDPTQAGEVVEGIKRSFGALSTGNLTPEQLTAMVSGGQSVGIQPGKAGTFVATMAKQLSMGSSKFLGKKNRQELNFASKELGFGDAKQLAQTYSKDSYATMMKVHENLAKMEASKRTQVAEALYGRQWSDEGLQMAQGVGGVRKTYGEISDSKNANFLDEAARQRSESLQGQWNSTKSIFNKFWDSFGSGFDDILTSINKYFLDLNSSFDYDKVKSYVVSFFDGVKDALGVKTWQDLLQNTFGGGLGNYGQQIRDFGKGITEGILGFVRGVRSVFEVFAGSNASAETIGKFAGQFIALTAALIVSGPAIALLNGIGLAVMGVASVALGAWRILKAAGLVGSTGLGSTPKVPETPGKGISRLGGRLGAAGAAAGFAGTSSLSKGEQNALSKRLGSWAQDREKSNAPATPWIDPPARNAIETLKEAVEENTLLHRQSYERESGFKGLIHKAAISSSEGPGQGVKTALESMGGRIQSAALSGSTALGGGLSGGAGPLGNSVPGSALGGSSGLSRRGILGGGSGGSASSNPANSAASAAMLDAIAGTESGKAGYDAVLGNGKYGTPNKPVSSMSLDEAFAFGRQIKSRHGTSSALGRYQIVGNTMRAAQKALGIGGDAPFNAENQDRMARWIARSQGLGAWEGLKGNPRAMAAAREALNQGGAQDSAASSAFGGGAGQYAGLRAKGSQASAGGASHVGITDLARQVQENLPGGVRHFGAFNDRYHQGTGSKHAQGLAFDTTLLDSGKSREAAQSIRDKLKAAGLDAGSYKVIDEYLNPSARSTGGHIHTQFNNQEAAKRYSDYTASLKKSGESIASTGWKKPDTPNAFGGSSNALGSDTPVRQEKIGTPGRVSGDGAGKSSGGGGSATIHINGQGLDSHSIANAVQRRWNEQNNRSTFDLDPQSV